MSIRTFLTGSIIYGLALLGLVFFLVVGIHVPENTALVAITIGLVAYLTFLTGYLWYLQTRGWIAAMPIVVGALITILTVLKLFAEGDILEVAIDDPIRVTASEAQEAEAPEFFGSSVISETAEPSSAVETPASEAAAEAAVVTDGRAGEASETPEVSAASEVKAEETAEETANTPENEPDKDTNTAETNQDKAAKADSDKSNTPETAAATENKDETVPEIILEFVEKYPEAQSYADGYFRYKDRNLNLDVSKDVTPGEIPLFIQWDKRWGYKHYGKNYIGVAGCGPTCLSMVVVGLTGDTRQNPAVISSYSHEKGYYVYGQGTSRKLMTKGAKNFGLKVETGKRKESYILENLSPATPMIALVGKGDFTRSGHFIVLTGIDEEGNVIVNDPNSPSNSEKHWSAKTLVSQMKKVWCYSYVED